MRFKVAALVFACLALAAQAQAHRFEVAPRFAASMPVGDISKAYDVGFSVGATATYWEDPSTGVGIDLVYHRWEASPAFSAALDNILSMPPYFVVTGSTSSVGIIQTTAHVEKLVPTRGPVKSWIKVGAGLYDYKTEFVILGQQLNHSQLEFGINGGLGFDYRAVGVDASYHYMLSRSSFNFGDHNQFLTAGVQFRLK